ncbi:MAG: hypothetical protein N2588_08165 [Rhodovarius sp.]|nr:hypothetical protein [Rhodovarius sp.]
MPLIRILRTGVLASCGWLALAALLWQHYGFLWALAAVILWAVLLRLFQQSVLAHARELADKAAARAPASDAGSRPGAGRGEAAQERRES